MNPREQWQSLQRHLVEAQLLADAGDVRAALAEVDAALRIDPEFLAAHSLRARLSEPARRNDDLLKPAGAEEAGGPLRSGADRMAAFEERVRQRRAQRCVAAAHSALAERRFKDAADAIEEIRAVKPDLPQLASLELLLEAGRGHVGGGYRLGRWVLAAGAFACVLLAASWLELGIDSRGLIGYPVFLQHLAAPNPAADASIETARDDGPPESPVLEPPDQPRQRTVRDDLRPPQLVATATEAPVSLTARFVEPPAAPPVAVTSGAMTPPPAYVPPPVSPPATAVDPVARPGVDAALANTAAPIAPPAVDDERLVRSVLQRYRGAYDRLDAPAAHAVWPSVDERALARAFDGLESQALTFRACDVEVRGAVASAVCNGSMRYVAKIGARSPREEPRQWLFTLRKRGDGWQIENARAER